jgi:hypothetical protein
MRKIISLTILIIFHTAVYSQLIKGTIFDQTTDSTLAYAAIYFNGTFAGTLSDINGYFELDASENLSRPLTVSVLGYNSVTLHNYISQKPLEIFLTPKIFEIREVSVTADSVANAKIRRANLKLFKSEFLGTSSNAFNCRILNESDILFKYDPGNDTLKAFAYKPILIDNKKLGYKITYYLDKFEYCKKSTALFFSGGIIFTEDLSTGQFQHHNIEIRRKTAYSGSRMHFFRSLWDNNLAGEGFTVKKLFYEELDYDQIVIQTDSLTKYLSYPDPIYVRYMYMTGSYIIILKERAFFDKQGYFDPFGVRFVKELAKLRVADQLPYEYTVE